MKMRAMLMTSRLILTVDDSADPLSLVWSPPLLWVYVGPGFGGLPENKMNVRSY